MAVALYNLEEVACAPTSRPHTADLLLPTVQILTSRSAARPFRIAFVSAARDWESDSPEQLEKEVSLTALDVLRIASRSRSNRAQLLSLGILPSLTRLMKVWEPLCFELLLCHCGFLCQAE